MDNIKGEVRSLAILNNVHIVHYYDAWLQQVGLSPSQHYHRIERQKPHSPKR